MSESLQLHYRLTGPAGLRGAGLAAFQASLLPMLAPEWQALGDWYTDQAKASFARKHGKSGLTEAETVSIPVVPNPKTLVGGASIPGHVGFVVSDLPSHRIVARNHPALGNVSPDAPGINRTGNPHSAFGPVNSVDWFQGGPESHAPDTSWYESLSGPLMVEVAASMDRFGALAQAAAQARFGPQTTVVYRVV